jgi:hypothetical protein
MKIVFYRNENVNKNNAATCHKYSSTVTCGRNKITKRRIILNSFKKSVRLIYYPTLNLSKKKAIGTINLAKKKKKSKIESVPYGLKYFSSLQSKKFSKLENLADSIFQFYLIDDDLKKCHHSVGNVIELCYNGVKKIVFLTVLDPACLKNSILYCSDRKDKMFLNFFEEMSNNNINYRENVFNLRKKHFSLYNLNFDLDSSYEEFLWKFRNSDSISQRDFNFLKSMIILEVPLDILKKIDYNSIPSLNLNCKNDSLFIRGFNQINESSNSLNLKFSKIFFLAQSFSLDDDRHLRCLRNSTISNKIISKIVDYNNALNKEKLENSGDLNVIYGIADRTGDILSKFDATCLTHGVGNLIYKAEGKFKPLGINIGTATNFFNENLENVYISFESETTLRFFRMYI